MAILTQLWHIWLAYWWLLVFFVFPALGTKISKIAERRRAHQIGLARARQGLPPLLPLPDNEDDSDEPDPEPEALKPSPHIRQEALDTLARRYASGEIDRETYLQRKVELEDLR